MIQRAVPQHLEVLDPDFEYLLGISGPEKRMRDVELVLRFAAFYHATYLKYRPPMRRFLNSDMERYRFIGDADSQELSRAFKVSSQVIRSLLGRDAFKRFHKGTDANPNGYWEPKKFNSSLYDILMWGFAQHDRNQLYQHLDSVREALIVLMTDDQEFIDSIELSTSSVKMVTTRFDKWRNALESILGASRREPRCFSRKLKEDLYERDATCAICENRIESVDDAAVDHVQQYWMGGRTIPENGRKRSAIGRLLLPRRLCSAVAQVLSEVIQLTASVPIDNIRASSFPLPADWQGGRMIWWVADQ
jgi:hypothetical protein